MSVAFRNVDVDRGSPPDTWPYEALVAAIERGTVTDWVRVTVASEVRRLVEASGLSMTDLARRVGTSRTRLSTYRSGRVVPSATMLVRLRTALEGCKSSRLRRR